MNTDLDKMIKILNEFNYEYSIKHSEPSEWQGQMIKGATTIQMVSDNEHKVHFYFDLNSDGGKMRGTRPTVF